MPLILAIEPDRRQAARISSLARERLNVELLVMDSAQRALETLAARTPDLILTPQLLSPKDEAALDDRLRQLDAAGSKVQTLMIPVLASTGRRGPRKDGLLKRLRRTKDEPATEGGCDPAVFAAQIAEYLEKAADERAAQAAMAEDERDYPRNGPASTPPVVDPPAPIRAAAEPVVVERAPFEFELPREQAKSAPEVEFEAQHAANDTPTDHYAFEFQNTAAEARAERAEFVFEAKPEPEPDFQAEYALPVPPIQRLPDALSTRKLDVEVEEVLNAFNPTVVVREDQPVPSVLKEIVEPEPFRPELVAKSVPSAFEEFVSFDEISLVETPTVGFDELQAFADEGDEPATIESMSVLDALEILDEPELSVPVDFQATERAEHKRRPIQPQMREVIEESEPEPSPFDFEFDKDLWMPLPVAAHARWPTLEGPVVKATFTPGFDAPPDPGVEFAPQPEDDDRASGKKRKGSKPYQDEWGFFDPVQCGFAALLAKLEEVTDKEDASSGPPAGR